MAEVPNVTANEMLAYKGNAAQGGSGVDYAYNPAIADPTAAIADTMKQFSAYANQLQTKQYDQKLKEREDFMQFLADTGKSPFNMKDAQGNNMGLNPLPQDADELQSITAEIRDAALANPSGYKFDKKVMGLVDRQKALTRMAGQRSMELSKMQQMAANTNDPDERARILKHIDDNILKTKVSDFKQVEPYMPDFKFNAETFYPKDLYKDESYRTTFGVKTVMDKDGNEIEVSEVGLIPAVADFRGKLRSDKAATNESKALLNAYQNSPILQTREGIQAVSDEARAVNRIRGLKPEDEHYITPYDELPATADAVDRAYSLLGPGRMAPYKTQKLKRDALSIQKEQSDMDADEQRLKLAREKHELNKAKMTADQRKEKAEDLIGADVVYEVKDIFNRGAKVGIDVLGADVVPAFMKRAGKTSFALSEIPSIDALNPNMYTSILENQGADLKGYKVVPTSNPNLEKMGTVKDLKRVATPKGEKEVIADIPPSKIYKAYSPDKNKDMFIFEYGDGTYKVVSDRDYGKYLIDERGTSNKAISNFNREWDGLSRGSTSGGANTAVPKAETEVTGKDGVKYIKVNGEWFVKP